MVDLSAGKGRKVPFCPKTFVICVIIVSWGCLIPLHFLHFPQYYLDVETAYSVCQLLQEKHYHLKER